MAMTPIVSLSNVRKTFWLRKGPFRREPLHAVDGVSLDIQPGEVLGLLGRNGAGKTTLIKMMAGLIAADGGTGTVLGHDIHRDHKAIRAQVSLVAPTADVGTDNNLTVRQNLEFWAVVYDLEPALRGPRIDEMLAFLGLSDYADFWPMSISAGMRQRLAIARSLLVKNPLLFLDEPTVKLDAQGAQAVRDLIRRINAEYGITIVLTTHIIWEAEELCDRVAILHRGKLVSCDSVDQLRKNLQRYDSCRIACGPVPDEVLAAIGAHPAVVSCSQSNGHLQVTAERLETVLFDTLVRLRAAGVAIEGVTTDEPTLEDVFVTTARGEVGSESGDEDGDGMPFRPTLGTTEREKREGGDGMPFRPTLGTAERKKREGGDGMASRPAAENGEREEA